MAVRVHGVPRCDLREQGELLLEVGGPAWRSALAIVLDRLSVWLDGSETGIRGVKKAGCAAGEE